MTQDIGFKYRNVSPMTLDFDGTIAQNDVLDPDVRKAIGELRAQGIVVALVTGRILEDLRRSMRTPNISWRPEDTLDLAPEDARRYGVQARERVRVVSCHGQTELPVRFTEDLQRGQAFATFHSAQALVNAVTGAGRDRQTSTPEYKVTAIRIETLSG